MTRDCFGTGMNCLGYSSLPRRAHGAIAPQDASGWLRRETDYRLEELAIWMSSPSVVGMARGGALSVWGARQKSM